MTTTTKIIGTKNIAATEFTMEANILTLSNAPSDDYANELFTNDSVVLEF